MTENKVDQPSSLSQLLRESYLAEARAHQRHSEVSRSDSSSRRLVYGTLKGKSGDTAGHEDPQFPDLSAFLSQEELDKSVNLARQAIGHDPREERPEVRALLTPPRIPSATPPTIPSTTPPTIPSATSPTISSATPPTIPSVTPPTIPSVTPPTMPSATPPTISSVTPAATPSTTASFTAPSIPFAVHSTPLAAPSLTPSVTPSVMPSTQSAPERQELPLAHSIFSADRQTHQPTMQDKVVRNNRASRPLEDFNMSARNTPYGPETQSKKEFLNKAADFIEELSSLFKANSSKRIRPRACKAHRSRHHTKTTHSDGAAFSLNTDDRERPVLPVEIERSAPTFSYQPEVQMDPAGFSHPGPRELPAQDSRLTEDRYDPGEMKVDEVETSVLTESPFTAEPVCEPPQFIQKLKSREVPEGSKVQLDCIVRGLPMPEVRWFCEGKELENSPDIQIINSGELHSLIIAEAFEEDTGRYSCFASNFYGTDSTSAEIYIEGASSTDSEGDQSFGHVEQLQGNTAKPAPSSPPEASAGESVGVEDSLPLHPSVGPEEEQQQQQQQQVASRAPSQVITASLPVQIAATALPVLEEPPNQVGSALVPAQEVTAPLPVQVVPPLSPVDTESAQEESVPPTSIPPTSIPPTSIPPTSVLPTSITPTSVRPTSIPPTSITPTSIPPTSVPPTSIPPTSVPPTSVPLPVLTTLPLTQVVSSALPIQVAPTQTALPESQYSNGSYPQGLDGRPLMAAPVFTKSLQDLLALDGQLVVLECRVKGVPSPKVDWYREGTAIEDSPDFRILQKKPRSMAESEEICTLVIAEVFPEDSGTFTCTASNKYGTVSSIAALRVKGNGTHSSHVKGQGSFIAESSQIPEAASFDLSASSLKPVSEAPVTNSIKPHSSTIRLDPLSSSTLRLDPLSTSTLRLDPHSSSMLRQDPLSTSLPCLDTLGLSSPRLGGSLSTSTSRLDPLYLSTLHQDLPGSSVLWPDTQNSRDGPSFYKPFSGALMMEYQSSSLKNDQEESRPPSEPAIGGTPGVEGTHNHQNVTPTVVPLPDPPTSCLKSGVLVNHNEPRSASRVGLRVHFRLPEDEEDEESDASSGQSHEDMAQALANKEPPPVRAKPKLDPVQLQLLHNQVLMEQQQEGEPPSSQQEASAWPARMHHHHHHHHQPQPLHQPQPQAQPLLEARPQFQSQPQPQFQPASKPQPEPAQPPLSTLPPVPLQNLRPAPILTTASAPPLNSTPAPVASATPALPPRTTFAPPLNLAPTPPKSSLPPPPQLNIAPAPLMTSPPRAPQLSTAPPAHHANTSPFGITSITTVTHMNTIHASHLNLAPSSLPRPHLLPAPQFSSAPAPPHLSPAPAASLSSIPASLNKGASFLQNTSPSPMLRATHASLMNLAATSQSFNYVRPKEFIAAQSLSPVRSPSPTESPVPLLNELAAELHYSLANNPAAAPFSPRPRVFPTRVLKSPTSPPSFVSSPTLMPAAFLNSVFALRPQSPPQASSPTSSSSTPSPIQNPVAFLSSVLPSLPPSQPTNAMGLPRSAPTGPPQGILRKLPRTRLLSDDYIRDLKDTLNQDIEKKLRFKDEATHSVQQKPTYEGKTASRPLGPNIPATVFNYDEEYKVSNFEQRLMSEIEFRLERTPVEESDDEVQHDEIPTGKCIAPIFDKKLKNFRAMEGVPVTFSCKILGIPIPKVYWFKDGKQILRRNDHYKKIREGDGTCALHIESTINDDDGNYTVMASNPQGRISCSGHLIIQTGPVRNRLTPMIHSQRVRARVQEVEEGEQTQERFFRPHFLQAPGDMLAHEGRLCRLDCKVSGLPNPELMWLVNGRPIYPDLYHKMLVRENGVHSLVIDPLTQNDAGTYTCIASNKAGQSSFCLELRVVEKEVKQQPQFVEKLQNTGIAEGSPVRLECRVVGMPPPIIFWKKDNDTIPHTKDRVIMHQDATGYVSLLIQPTRKEDAGWYTVSAKNEAGIISCTARLDIYAQWHQQVPLPMKKSPKPGSRYAALTGQGLDIRSAFPTTDNSPILFSSSPEEATLESEEL